MPHSDVDKEYRTHRRAIFHRFDHVRSGLETTTEKLANQTGVDPRTLPQYRRVLDALEALRNTYLKAVDTKYDCSILREPDPPRIES